MRFSKLRRMTYQIGWNMNLPRSRKRLIVILVILIVLAVMTAVISVQIRPLIKKMAVAEVTNVVSDCINEAIVKTMGNEDIDYEDLVTLEKNESGEITALVTNMAQINTLSAQISNEVLNMLGDNTNTIIKIPITNILGSTVFAGRGPALSIKIISVSSINTQFSNEFTSAGINQTKHQIMLEVSVTINFLIPGAYTTANVSTDVCIAETVIVGSVPNTYADFG